MRRLSDLHEVGLGRRAHKGLICYYEHADEAEKRSCGKIHMTYDVSKDCGFFGNPVLCCDNCAAEAEP
jgi:hypothetical protein